MSFGLFELGLFCFVIFLCVYCVVDRICKCVETKHMAMAFDKFTEKTKLKYKSNDVSQE